MRGLVVVWDCKMCCEGRHQLGSVAMTLVLRIKDCMLGCLVSEGLRSFFGS